MVRSVGVLIVLAGLYFSAGAQARPGDLDRSFSGDGISTALRAGSLLGFYSIVAVQSDDSVVQAAGDKVVRYLPSGNPDGSFGSGPGGVVTVASEISSVGIGAIAVDSFDRILIAARFHGAGPSSYEIVRLTPDGEVDTTFGQSGAIPATSPYFVLDPSGGLVLGTPNGIERYLSNGRPDLAFATAGRFEGGDERFGPLALRADGSIVALRSDNAGMSQEFDGPALVQLRPGGTLDPAFAGDGVLEFNPEVFTCCYIDLALGLDGSAYLRTGSCGAGLYPNANCSGGMARVTRSGEIDRTFSGAFQPNVGNRKANLIAIDGEGRLLAANGNEQSGSRTVGTSVVRALPDGSVDRSFGSGGTMRAFPNRCRNSASSLAVDSAGRAVVGLSCGGLSVARLSNEAGRANTDADRFPDRRDRCVSDPAPHHMGCHAVLRELRSPYFYGSGLALGAVEIRAGRAKGRIPPPDSGPERGPKCVRRVSVAVKRAGPGRDRVAARLRTDLEGVWRSKRAFPRGRYYAETPGIFVGGEYCAPAVSSTRWHR